MPKIRLAGFFAFFLLVAAKEGKASRTVYVPPCHLTWYKISINNPTPSTSPAQTVTITFQSTNNMYLSAMSPNVSCSTTQKCKTAAISVNAGGNLTAAVALESPAGTVNTAAAWTDMGVGVTATITVNENQGFLTGSFECQYGSDLNVNPIIGGRPF